jgi:transcriptional regulator with XRE-family HTH domain
MSRSIHSPSYAALREMLIAARRSAGLTQDEVARRLERPQSFVAKYEGGERRLDVVEFIALARALEQDPLVLFRNLVDAAHS